MSFTNKTAIVTGAGQGIGFEICRQLAAAGANVLLRTSADSGHGMGSSLQQRIEEAVDVNAFLFAQLGVDYRPVKP